MSNASTKERILSEAEKQFIEFGILGTQMKDIAIAININRRTLYRYFPTKDELAFEVELSVMTQILKYMNFGINDTQCKTGYEKVQKYFDHVNAEDIREQMKFTAEFDRYFQDDYPSLALEESLVTTLSPSDDYLYQYIAEGIEDQSIRNDLTVDELYHFISQNFFALFQRLLLRERHLKREYCDQIDFQTLFTKIILNGIKNSH